MRFCMLCFGFIVASHLATAIDLSTYNFAHHYDIEPEIRFQYRITESSGVYQLLTRISTHELDSFGINAYLQTGYTDTTHVLIEVDSEDFDSGSRLTSYNFKKEDTTQNLLVIEVLRPGKANRYFDILIDDLIDFGFAPFTINSGQSTLFKSYLDHRSNVQFQIEPIAAYQYSQNFPAAMPPMTTKFSAPDNSFKMDSVFWVNGDLDLLEDKLYFFQSDTSGFRGVSLVSTTPIFPKLVTLQDLIEPMIYITSRNEYSIITNADNQKLEMDKFWLEATSDKERAIKLIRDYFMKVKQANELFTTYKEGWKTDKGMIFILFGSPDKVVKSLLKEQWIFERIPGSPSLEFTFNKVKNIFSEKHFVLERKVSYNKIWYRQVDLWRKGRI